MAFHGKFDELNRNKPTLLNRRFISDLMWAGTARYAGLLLAPAKGFGLWPRPFFALWAKKRGFYFFFYYFFPNFGHFQCSVVTSVTFSSNLREGYN